MPKSSAQLEREIAEALAPRTSSSRELGKEKKAIGGLRNDPPFQGEMKRSPSEFIEWLLQSYGPGRKAKDSRFHSKPMTRSEAQRAMKVLRTSPGFSTFYADKLDSEKARDLVLSFRHG